MHVGHLVFLACARQVLLCLDTPGWMSMMMKIFSVFMSKKLMKRMQVCAANVPLMCRAASHPSLFVVARC